MSRSASSAISARLTHRRARATRPARSGPRAEIARDVAKRSYITAGFAAFVLLVPLAVTSTNAMIRRLGGSRWKRLHSTVYLIDTLAVLHFLRLVKADIREPFIYGILLTALPAFRIPPHGRRMPAKEQPARAELTPAKFL
ncbi:MAG: sulfite oxidase heme-binding subunit YedZ [Chromatiales bacterium]